MFRANLVGTFLGPDRPAWVDQLLSPESLRATGCFDPEAVRPERGAAAASSRRLSPRGFVYDAGLTSVVTTQLWHHIYCGGGLCDLPTWTAAVPPDGARSPSPGQPGLTRPVGPSIPPSTVPSASASAIEPRPDPDRAVTPTTSRRRASMSLQTIASSPAS